MFFKCFDQCKIFNRSVMLFGITAFVMKIKSKFGQKVCSCVLVFLVLSQLWREVTAAKEKFESDRLGLLVAFYFYS